MCLLRTCLSESFKIYLTAIREESVAILYWRFRKKKKEIYVDVSKTRDTDLWSKTPSCSNSVTLLVNSIHGGTARAVAFGRVVKLCLIASTLVQGHVVKVLVVSGLDNGLVLQVKLKLLLHLYLPISIYFCALTLSCTYLNTVIKCSDRDANETAIYLFRIAFKFNSIYTHTYILYMYIIYLEKKNITFNRVSFNCRYSLRSWDFNQETTKTFFLHVIRTISLNLIKMNIIEFEFKLTLTTWCLDCIFGTLNTRHWRSVSWSIGKRTWKTKRLLFYD